MKDDAQKQLLDGHTRETARLLISAHFTGMKDNNNPAVGFAYVSTNVYQKYRRLGARDNFVAEPFTVTFPAWHPRSGQSQSLTKGQKNLLYTFYQQEDELVKALTRLFEVVGQATASRRRRHPCRQQGSGSRREPSRSTPTPSRLSCGRAGTRTSATARGPERRCPFTARRRAAISRA